eukprot:TRINITY_DN14048_c0_g1_i1.p1 TRINITY_DN14048_c0_g1~~TRINITY_DN14048_c0_g1_i1.p1  ORF type:complete len:263 (+),score=50.25 TRINITY_DN14048_c0_g1_i1:240-1028(+)
MGRLEGECKNQVYKEIKQIFGVDIQNVERALQYRDYLVSAKQFGHKLPVEISELGMQQLNKLYAFYEYEMYLANIKVGRVLTNELLQELKQELNKSFTNPEKKNRRTMITYITEKRLMLSILRLLEYRLKDGELIIPDSSSIFIEVFKSYPTADEFSVRIKFNEELVSWKEGQKEIDLPKFFSFIEKQQFEYFEDFCKDGEEQAHYAHNYAGILVPFFLGGALMIAGVVYIHCFRKEKKEEDALTIEAENGYDQEEPTVEKE